MLLNRINTRLTYVRNNPHKACMLDVLLNFNLEFFSGDNFTHNILFDLILLINVSLINLCIIIISLCLSVKLWYYSKVETLILRGYPSDTLIRLELTKTENLSISHSRINSLTLNNKSLLPLTLKSLTICRSELTILEGLPDGLLHINLAYNKLTEISQHSLSRNLTHIILNNNSIKKIHYSALPKTLRYLDVHANKLTRLPRLPENMREITYHNNKLPRKYGKHKTVCQLRPIIEAALFNDGIKIMKNLQLQFNIMSLQRRWRKYWYQPYHDNKYPFLVSRYMLKHILQIN